MPSVLSCLASTLLLIAAAVRINDGLNAYADAAAAQTQLNHAEYALHQCGAQLAAAENIALAADYLTADGSSPHDWSDIAARVQGELIATADLKDCDARLLRLHAESPEGTPTGFPNVIYRLRWHDEEFPHG